MAEITISLPDGSQRSLPAGATATTLAESIGSRLAKAAVAAVVDGDEWDLGRDVARRRHGGHHHGRHRRGASCAAAQHGARARPGRHAVVPRGEVLHRPGHRPTASTTTSSCPAAARSPRPTWPTSRPDARDHEGRPAVRARRAAGRRGAAGVRRPAVQVRDHRACLQRRGRQRRRRRDRRRRDDQRLPQHTRVRRPVPRPARARARASSATSS